MSPPPSFVPTVFDSVRWIRHSHIVLSSSLRVIDSWIFVAKMSTPPVPWTSLLLFQPLNTVSRIYNGVHRPQFSVSLILLSLADKKNLFQYCNKYSVTSGGTLTVKVLAKLIGKYYSKACYFVVCVNMNYVIYKLWLPWNKVGLTILVIVLWKF